MKRLPKHISLLIIAAAAIVMSLGACGRSGAKDAGSIGTSDSADNIIIADTVIPMVYDDSDEPAGLSDTLRAVTLYGPTSYFIYRGVPMGYDYSLLKQYARSRRQALRLLVAPTLSDAIEMLDDGRAELLAYDVPITAHYRRLVLACGPENYTTQVLVQPKIKGKGQIGNVTELVDREVYVIADSKYERRLQNLETELAANIDIRTVPADSATAEDLISMVSEGKIPLTVVDSDIARLNETYFHDLDISTEVSTPQRSSWAVALGNTALADSVNSWFKANGLDAENVALLKQYFEMSKSEPYQTFDFSKGFISRYDDLFRKYSAGMDWDWRLLAAQAYAESHFNPRARSWVGARGLMQIMPATGRSYGARTATLNDPDVSVRVAARFLSDLNRYLLDKVPSDKERTKFIIAAYNCGIGHIYDAMALARKYGLDPTVWDDNVEKALLMKMNPKYYNDPVVRYGYARGSETSAYVKRIMKFYDNAKREIMH